MWQSISFNIVVNEIQQYDPWASEAYIEYNVVNSTEVYDNRTGTPIYVGDVNNTLVGGKIQYSSFYNETYLSFSSAMALPDPSVQVWFLPNISVTGFSVNVLIAGTMEDTHNVILAEIYDYSGTNTTTTRISPRVVDVTEVTFMVYDSYDSDHRFNTSIIIQWAVDGREGYPVMLDYPITYKWGNDVHLGDLL